MPTLFRGIQWSTYRSGPLSCDFLLAAPASCYIEGFFLGPLLRMPALSWGIQWSAYLSGLRRATSFLPLLFWASSWVIIGLIPLSSMLQFVGAFFRTYLFKPRYPVVLGPGFLQKAVYLRLLCWPFQ